MLVKKGAAKVEEVVEEVEEAVKGEGDPKEEGRVDRKGGVVTEVVEVGEIVVQKGEEEEVVIDGEEIRLHHQAEVVVSEIEWVLVEDLIVVAGVL